MHGGVALRNIVQSYSLWKKVLEVHAAATAVEVMLYIILVAVC